MRNPPGSGHAPHSDEGCRILVKLRQFDAGDSRQCAVDTVNSDDWRPLPNGNGAILPLHEFGGERVCMLRLSEGELLPLSAHAGGLELFVLDGTLRAMAQPEIANGLKTSSASPTAAPEAPTAAVRSASVDRSIELQRRIGFS